MGLLQTYLEISGFLRTKTWGEIYQTVLLEVVDSQPWSATSSAALVLLNTKQSIKIRTF